ELFYRAALGNVDVKEIKAFLKYRENPVKPLQKKGDAPKLEQLVTNARGSSNMLVIGDDMQKLDYKLSPCCNPIPGDDVFGFITINEGIKIHRVNCPNAIKLLSNYAYRVVKAKWMNDQMISFLAGIKIVGTDEIGLVNNITKVISNENNVNMRSINFDTEGGMFEGTIMIYVHDTKHLNHLIDNLKKVKGVNRIERIDEKH
ncbi:MAG: bifunctional (p)ppGpp synthetase/guanosine-3,5-bis(diphosphate) 3-pyrophosphohydrolase, partial [Bacteroidetes bacterium]|nr:bifunctional (p)ppGpp synthetase/guanosine-3,5-bis(diphosphate) 3-pyrophosphohydrolase [Bacteroidota bacterium]